MLEDMFYLFLSKIVRTEPVHNVRPKRNRPYSLCLSLCVCVCVSVSVIRLDRATAGRGQESSGTCAGWFLLAADSPPDARGAIMGSSPPKAPGRLSERALDDLS